MHPFRYTIHLRLHHPDIDPDLISVALELKPFVKYQAGKPRIGPKGTQLGKGVSKQTYWCSEGVRGEGHDLADTLESQVQKLEEKRDFLDGFCTTGGWVELYISWFTGEDNTGEVFDWSLLQRLATLKVTLDIDVYGGRDPGKETSEDKNSERTSKP